MLTLGIETSCDETSVALVNKRKILAQATFSSVRFYRPYGGIIPEIASRKQFKFISLIFRKALKDSGCRSSDIKAVAVTQGPGLIGSLMVGVQFAQGISLALKIPLIGIDHLKAHLFAAFLNRKEKIFSPFIGLVASGGHTNIYLVYDFDKMELLGETLDDACGEALDKVGRFYGLDYPAAVYIDKLFSLKFVDRGMFKIKKRQDFNFSFSGIKTAAVYKKTQEQRQPSFQKIVLSSFQYAIVENLILLLQKATETFKIKNVVCGGGVLANRFLRRRLQQEAAKREWRVLIPPRELCSDNAAGVAGLGEYLGKKRGFNSGEIEPYSVSKRD